MLMDSELGVPPGTKVSSSDPFQRGLGNLTNFGSTPETSVTIGSIGELRGPILDVGIFRDTLLPSVSLHAGLSLIAYGIGRSTDRVDSKDWLWAAAPIINTWWSGVGRRYFFRGLTFNRAVNGLSRPEKLLLGGVTLWGGHLLYRIAGRSVARRRASADGKGSDDARYAVMKRQEGFWNSALLTLFIPEALLQAVIGLPLVAPFRHQGGVFTGYHPYMQSLSVGLYAAGFALEVLGETQLRSFKKAKGDTLACTEGVWSIGRNPLHLGDILIHLAFPLLLFSSDMLAPVELLGPVVNYLFLRYRRQAKRNTASSTARYLGAETAESEPDRGEPIVRFGNKWTWVVIGAGAAFAGLEHSLHFYGFY